MYRHRYCHKGTDMQMYFMPRVRKIAGNKPFLGICSYMDVTHKAIENIFNYAEHS